MIVGSLGVELRKDRLLGEWELPANLPVLARVPVISMAKGGVWPGAQPSAQRCFGGGGAGFGGGAGGRPAVFRGRGLSMYEQHFGLTRNPFSMTPEPALVYMTPGHREALAGLAYAILERKGFVMLTGRRAPGNRPCWLACCTICPPIAWFPA